MLKIIFAAIVAAVGLGKALHDFEANPVISRVGFCAGFSLALIGILVWTAGRISLGKSYAINLSTPPKIIKKGIYKYIRHPVYLGFYLFAVGVPTIFSPPTGILMAAMALPLMVYDILTEERFLTAKFKDYRNYCRKTKRIIPFVW